MKKTNAWMIFIICFMMLFLLSGIANAQELLIQPQQAEPTEKVEDFEETVASYEYIGSYLTDYDLQYELGMEKLADTFWKRELTKYKDYYLFLNDYGEVTTSFIILKDPRLFALSHNEVVNELLDSVDEHVRKSL